MRTIGFIKISRRTYGGLEYNDMAQKALSREFQVESVLREPKIFSALRYLRLPESVLRLLFLKGEKDLWIRDFYSTLTLPFDRTQGKNLVIIHHDDFSGFPLLTRPIFALFQKILFYWALKKADVIVTVSEYWKQHFLQKGYKRVEKIENGFDLAKYEVSAEEVEAFKKRSNLADKPIVYLGNCQKAKGVGEAYEALKGLDAHLVTSGSRKVRIPARNLELEDRDYLCLLKASQVVLALSRFKEGWGRTPHEAMLLRTPVIGSGKGGMRELLEGGNQEICGDLRLLRQQVRFLLEHPEVGAQMGEMGYTYARQFSLERFEKAWLEFLRRLL